MPANTVETEHPLSLLHPYNPAQGVTIDGKDWVKIADYVNVSYDDLALIYDTSTGFLYDSANATIGALDFTGFVWASGDEVALLFSYYYGSSSPLTDGNILGSNTAWTPRIIADFGGTSTEVWGTVVDGWTRLNYGSDGTFRWANKALITNGTSFDWMHVLRVEPDNFDFLFSMADFLLNRGRTNEAMWVVRRVVEKHQENTTGIEIIKYITRLQGKQ